MLPASSQRKQPCIKSVCRPTDLITGKQSEPVPLVFDISTREISLRTASLYCQHVCLWVEALLLYVLAQPLGDIIHFSQL